MKSTYHNMKLIYAPCIFPKKIISPLTFASVAKTAAFQMPNIVEKPKEHKQMLVTHYMSYCFW